MTGTDWLLSLHVLSAGLYGAALTGFWAVVLTSRGSDAALAQPAAERVSRPLTVAVSLGALGAVVFGIWLAIVEDRYHVWDGWIIAAIVLWAAATGLGARAGTAFTSGTPEGRRSGTTLHALSSVAFVLVLVLMIWKPGS